MLGTAAATNPSSSSTMVETTAAAANPSSSSAMAETTAAAANPSSSSTMAETTAAANPSSSSTMAETTAAANPSSSSTMVETTAAVTNPSSSSIMVETTAVANPTETKIKLGRISLDTSETIYNLDSDDTRLRLHAFCGTGVCTHINQSQMMMCFNLCNNRQWLDDEEIAMVRDGIFQFCHKITRVRDLSWVLNRPGAFLTAVKGIIKEMQPADDATIVTWSENITEFAIEAALMGGRKRADMVIMVIELGTVSRNPEVKGGNDCAVCFGGLDNGRKIATLPCSHSFHNLCLAQWFEKNKQCPLCRAEATMFSF